MTFPKYVIDHQDEEKQSTSSTKTMAPSRNDKITLLSFEEKHHCYEYFLGGDDIFGAETIEITCSARSMLPFEEKYHW
jgi:hypothetical protein